MSPIPPQKAPPRLTEGDTQLARLLTAAATAPFESSLVRRERVWIRMNRWKVPLRFLVPAAALTVALAAGWQFRPEPAPLAPATLALRGGPVEVGEELRSRARVEVGQLLRFDEALHVTGRAFARFTGGGALFLGDTQATLATQRGRMELSLASGEVIVSSDLATVIGGEYRIEGDDALFAVKVELPNGPEVVVHEGAVVVRRGLTRVSVSAGQSWSSQLGSRPAGGEQPLLPLVRALSKPGGEEAPLSLEASGSEEIFLDGVSLGRGAVTLLTRVGAHAVSAEAMVSEQVEVKAGATPRLKLRTVDWAEGLAFDKARQQALDGFPVDAVAGFERLARGTGSRAAASLYEIGRIRLDPLQDAEGALAAFTEHQRRFPSGALIEAVALGAIEAQLQLHQLEPALAAAEAFLARFPTPSRLNHLHFLQARVRQQQGDCAAALPLLAGVLADPTHAEEALYLTATCERAVNNPAAARERLQQSLARFPNGKHADEVKAALGK